ncbi:hypothetical protein AB0L53_28930 [Nonomuraea sp. NPDC052129]|uniref:hypothetical protein n=1 Tax=Nonomuraea sp. NPDC052129 TaxID=3154651 RepID=UPI003429ADB2
MIAIPAWPAARKGRWPEAAMLAGPWEAWETFWRAALGTGDFRVGFRMEIVGAVVAVCVLVWLLVLLHTALFLSGGWAG